MQFAGLFQTGKGITILPSQGVTLTSTLTKIGFLKCG